MALLINTINGTYDRCVSENIGISKNLIRSLVSSGQIPVIRAGRTVLINYDVLMRYLETGSSEPQTGAGDIKPVPVKVR